MMRKIVQLKKDNQGFTLVELMIVVAIIGILAAIAIPQFAAYRIRGYNSSGLSDVRNLATSQSAFFADWQRFGISAPYATQALADAGAPVAGVGALVTGGAAGVLPFIQAIDGAPATRSLQIGLGNGVSLQSNVNAAGGGLTAWATFIGISKHLQGDTYFATDGDSSIFYSDPVTASNGTALVLGLLPASTAIDNLAVAANVGPSGDPWSKK